MSEEGVKSRNKKVKRKGGGKRPSWKQNSGGEKMSARKTSSSRKEPFEKKGGAKGGSVQEGQKEKWDEKASREGGGGNLQRGSVSLREHGRAGNATEEGGQNLSGKVPNGRGGGKWRCGGGNGAIPAGGLGSLHKQRKSIKEKRIFKEGYCA